MKAVMLLTGTGQIGMAIARWLGRGMKIVIGDKNFRNAENVAVTMQAPGLDVTAMEMALSSRESIKRLIAEAQKYGRRCFI